MYKVKFNITNVESNGGKNYIEEEKRSIVIKYLGSAEIWKGLGLMFFYQFAGYNVVSFYATSILKSPNETEEELIHPKNTMLLELNVDSLNVKDK